MFQKQQPKHGLSPQGPVREAPCSQETQNQNRHQLCGTAQQALQVDMKKKKIKKNKKGVNSELINVYPCSMRC